MNYTKKYIDYNDLDKIIKSNDLWNCTFKKGAERFIKSKPSKYPMHHEVAVVIENIPKVRTRNDVIKTGIGKIIRAESIGFADGWCLDYNAPFCCSNEAVSNPYCADEFYDDRAKISDLIDIYFYTTGIKKEYWQI